MDNLPAEKKVCSRCHAEKQADDYYFKDRAKNRRDSICKACRINAKSEWIKNHRDQHSKYVRAWQKRNPDKCDESAKRFRSKRGERLRTLAREQYAEKRRDKKAAYREINADRIREQNAEYRKRKTDAIKNYNASYYERNKDRVLARIARCNNAKPELYKQLHKAAKHRRKVRLVNQGPHERFTDAEIFERDGWICKLCGEPVDESIAYPNPKSASLDHVLPIAKGGGHTRANCQLAHLGCNSRKRDRLVALAG